MIIALIKIILKSEKNDVENIVDANQNKIKDEAGNEEYS